MKAAENKMGDFDFFDDDETLDFDDEDNFIEFEKSRDYVAIFNNFIDNLTIKHLYAFIGVLIISTSVYFINYRINGQKNLTASSNESTVVENTTTTLVNNTTTTVASTTTTLVNNTTTTVASTTNTTNVNKDSSYPLEFTVMVLLPDCGYMGSGTIVSKLGFILTNEHVISDDGTGCNDYIVIAVSDSGDKDPIPKYLAKIVEENSFLDIAILEIVGTYDGSILPRTFSNMCVGNSDDVALGDELLIWGYPDVRWTNFDSLGRIDVSPALVSGFDAETNLSEKAWVSLSSSISSGNSGGGAYSTSIELIGVPTAVYQGNFSSRGLLRPINLILEYFDDFYFEKCK